MGVVHCAQDTRDDRLVALKVLSGSAFSAADDSARRFLRETRILERLRHPNIVSFYEVGLDEGRPYFAMELLSGSPLSAFAGRPWPETLPLLVQIRDGMEYLASRSVVQLADIYRRRPSGIDPDGVGRVHDTRERTNAAGVTPMKTRITAIALLLLATPALGQLESPLLSKIRLNLENPGGKSLAMGGAFVALADDATAALANPAGLTQTTSWQIGGSEKLFSFKPELRRALYSLAGDGTYQKFLEEADRPQGRQQDLEFASIVGPIGRRTSIAIYRAENLRYRLDADKLAGGNYRAFALAVPPNSAVTLDEQGGVDIRNELWGVSLATNMGALSIGGGVTFNRLHYDLTGSAAGGGHLFITNAESVQGIPGAQPRLDTTVAANVTSGTKSGWVAGFRWQVFEVGNVVLGGVYRKAPRFDVAYSVSSVNAWNGARVSFSCGVDDPNVPGSGASACGTFDVPDDWSVGLTAQLHPSLLVSAELERVAYSQLQEGFVPLFAYCTVQASPCPAQNRVIPQGHADDGSVPRVGAEWTLPLKGALQVALRGGWHRQPATGMKVDLYPDADRDRRPDPGSAPAEIVQPPLTDAFHTTYDGGKAEDHVSFGIGLTIGRKLSVDLAADLATSNDAYVVSAFYRF